jgi:hypothetical protein
MLSYLKESKNWNMFNPEETTNAKILFAFIKVGKSIYNSYYSSFCAEIYKKHFYSELVF